VSVDIRSSSQGLYVIAQVTCFGIPVQEGTLSTSFSLSDSHLNAFVWNTSLNFQVKVKDLSVDASVIFTAWDPSDGAGGKIYGVTTLDLFDSNGRLKTGHQKLIFYPCAPLNLSASSKRTNQPLYSIDIERVHHTVSLGRNAKGERYASYSEHDQAFLMEKRIEEYEQRTTSNYLSYNTQKPSAIDRTSVSYCSWLDSITRGRMECALEGLSCRDVSPTGRRTTPSNRHPRQEERALERLFCLIIELPVPPYPILFEEKQYAGVASHVPPSTLAQMMPPGCGVVVEKEERRGTQREGHPATILDFSLSGGVIGNPLGTSSFTGASLCVTADWDKDEDNLAEQQYRCLAHAILRGKLDPSVKPSLEDKGKIDRILNAAGTHMVFKEMDLLYRYRYFLTENKKALIKFLLSVDWGVESEVAEVPILLAQWRKKAPLEMSDALRLLGKEKAFQSLIVRQYAVETLRTASDDELLTFLLQLVQALRYELPVGEETPTRADESTYNGASSFSSSFAWTRLGMSTSGKESLKISMYRRGHSESSNIGKVDQYDQIRKRSLRSISK
jgi:phosphatidylinositol 3-kinase